MIQKKFIILLLTLSHVLFTHAQRGLVNTSQSPFAAMQTMGINDVSWTAGFWKERFSVCTNTMFPQLWQTYTSDTICYAFKNFKVAAGMETGRFRGPSFHDGDFYKTLEAAAALYAAAKDPKIDRMMDDAIAVIAKAQRADGYVYTKNIIEEKQSGKSMAFDDVLSFEAYNFGHLMTAASIHHRATGKKNLLDIATKAANFLIGFYAKASATQARNAICPSHYMGLTELYRTTGEKKYLTLADYLITIRGTVEGTDDNSDRAPFREMTKVAGHAVRANYLFAGAADVYAETGDPKLKAALDALWDNVTNTKLYVTGGCGALYDGVSVDGTSYKPDTVQKVHQSYGRDFQLPNLTAYNETCANIGNVLWNWRMFLLTGESKYIDVLELSLYNSVLSGVGLEGQDYFYTNPLASSADFPYHMRWEGGRQAYISKSNCCPPNTVRTIAEVQHYQYSKRGTDLFVNMYSGNTLKTNLENGQAVVLEQRTDYPWAGRVNLKLLESPADMALNLRIPAWCKQFSILVNGTKIKAQPNANGYVRLFRKWTKNDLIVLDLSMPVQLIESNPLVEESRNQVTVKKGPLVYCLESPDLKGAGVFDCAISYNASFVVEDMLIGNSNIKTLKTNLLLVNNDSWQGKLYREINTQKKPISARLIPYYAWANRGKTDMTVWLPLVR
ncbi:MAG: hypothetical protein RL394_360 [Bacteroidota bacterium]